MRPHRLRLSAFGPFAGTVEVDFDALGGGGVFLLHGETGAGKTTVLDALGFALYGRVPGERSKTRRFRSDHADAGCRTSVQVEVTVASRRLRITRSPEHTRPKRRGSGLTAEPAKLLLEELTSGGWEVLSTRLDEGSAEIADLMGMSAEQFFQVVLLPQNDFARFLRANSEDRGALLERLFGTNRFGRAEAWLAEQRRETSAAVAGAQSEIDLLSARLAQAAGGGDPAGPLDADQASGLLTATQLDTEAARTGVIARQAVADQAQAAAVATRELFDRQQRRRAALDRHRELEAAEPVLAALRAELSSAQRAAEVAAVLAEADRRSTARDATSRTERDARQRLRRVAEFGADVHVPPPVLAAAAARCRARSGRLDALHGVAETASGERAAAAVAGRDADRLASELATGVAALAALPAQRAAGQAALDAARAAQLQLPVEIAAAGALREAQADAGARCAARGEIRRLGEQLLDARERAVAEHQRALALREARVDGMIAELAAALEAGTPCPVCGSLSHPDPSEVRGTSVSRDQEEAAYATAESASRVVADVEAQIAGARATVAALSARLTAAGHDAEADQLAAVGGTQDSLVADLTRTAEAWRGAERAVADMDQASAQLSREQVSGTEQLRAAEAVMRGAQERASAAQQTLAAQLDGAPGLATAIADTEQAADWIAAAIAAVEAADRAAFEATGAEAAAAAAVTAAGFLDTGAAAAAHRSEQWREQARRRLESDAAQRVAVEGALSDPALSIRLEPPADVAAAELETVATAGALGDAQRRHSVAAERTAAVGSLVPRLLESLRRLAPLRARAGEARGLADLVSGLGGNELRMTLTSFVLAARLEEVAAAASERLLRMTSGRYTLAHTDLGRGGARAGLGLLVRDSWTGCERDTGTLSGGETFLASLALALGLADVVTEEAGGAPIEALFVDEGFGTLDEDTLDEVMDVLDGLRAGGRMVGLVSHVPELRQRLPSQVRVAKGRTGSELTLIGC